MRSLKLYSYICCAFALAAMSLAARCRGEASDAPAARSERSPLPVPSSLALPEYERLLFKFLEDREYAKLGWAVDKKVRDTGPYLNGTYYGTHLAVRIYYSPEIIAWLADGKRSAIPDGAIMIKEHFEAPAARYHELPEEKLLEHLSSWAIMVKDAKAAHDGWFWSNPAKAQKVVDNHQYPFDHPVSGYGIYCVRCHASAKTTGDTNEYTFAALRNIKGFPGEPIIFNVDDSWRQKDADEDPGGDEKLEDTTNEARVEELEPVKDDSVHPRCTGAASPEMCQPVLNEAFLKQFPAIGRRPRNEIAHFPPVTHDWVVRRPADSQQNQPFVTSNQCMSCHAGLVAPFGPAMFAPTGESADYGEPGVHLSPYGEWRWTPMGLAGRDPIFFAQLESEIALLEKDLKDDPQRAEKLVGELVDACLTCHGAMGKHQFDIDHGGQGRFGLEHVMRASTDPAATGKRHWRYGALARDGISCTVCHHMQPREQPKGDDRPYLEYFLETSITGNIHLGKPGELYGPWEDKEIAPYAMEHAMGFTPKHNAYTKSSQMCGSCHVVNLPIVDKRHEHGDDDELIAAEVKPAFKEFHHHLEQATYLEWLNSEFENEIDEDNPKAQTCQDCHMARDYHNDEAGVHLDTIETRIAAIQDTTYPEAESLASHQELEVRRRPQEYSRHNFRGLNVFLLEMFNQFDDVLGVRKFDFMTGSTLDIPHARADFERQAREDTAKIDVDVHMQGDDQLVATVEVRNETGHRFPTGVGFRRAILELFVLEKPEDGEGKGRVVWSSGQTNELGVLVDGEGNPLPCEFFSNEAGTNKQAFQPHHEVITSPGQVQIYETLLWSAEHKFTTSFIHGSEVVKDNRLLPRGWKKDGPGGGLRGAFLRATHPCQTSLQDPRYTDGSGSDQVIYQVKLPAGVDRERLTVEATLYYQAIPPYFLQSLFETAPDGPATQRLHYICSNIDLRNTPIENWKLPVVTASADVR
jgi:hypothetical protein